MATGSDRIFIDDKVKDHLIGLLSDSDKEWGINFVNGDVLPVSVNGDDCGHASNEVSGYVGVRGQRGIDVQRNENIYY